MSGAAEELAVRLHRRLVETAASRPEEAGPLTVGEVYHDLIPYRGVRGELGVFELAAYEHALLRLLAGDVASTRVVDPAARSEFAAELRSPNPILGIYRDYASLEVTLGEDTERNSTAPAAPTEDLPARTDESRNESAPQPVPAEVPELASSARASVAPLPELPGSRPAAPADATRVARSAPPAPHSPPAARTHARTECIDCRAQLPRVEGLRFCPHCGTDQSQTPCSRCSTPLRAEWSFCIRCGAPRSTD